MVILNKATLYGCVLFMLTTGLVSVNAVADVETVVMNNERAVLVIEGVRADGTTVQSSGCVVLGDGLVLTTAHQVDGVDKLTGRLVNGVRFNLSPIIVDVKRELALLKADRPLPDVVRIGDARQLRAGAPIITIATPVSLDFSVSSGIVANPNRTYRGYPVIQAELTAAPGSSGGPVFNSAGEVVGLIVGVLQEQEWATIIVPINNAYSLLSSGGVPGLPAQEPAPSILIPAPDISTVELRALEAYNQGTILQDPEQKIEYYGLAAQLLPRFYEAWFNLGVAAHAAGDTKRAVEAYRHAIAIRADGVEAFRNLGRIHVELEQHEEAVAAFDQALRLMPEAAKSHNDIGEAYRMAGRFNDAIAAFNRAIEIDGAYVNAHYNVAIAYMQNDQAAQARKAFETYLELAPDAPDRKAVENMVKALANSAE